MTPEQILDRDIMIWCGEHDMLCFHINVFKGVFWNERAKREEYIQTGVPNGWPDLTILSNDGVASFCETKIHPRKPTEDQKKIIGILRSRGFNAFVAYSLEEFIEKMQGGLDNDPKR